MVFQHFNLLSARTVAANVAYPLELAGIHKAEISHRALLAASKLFELVGTRSTLGEHNLDRFWRDARTHTLHDPIRWKYHAVGQFYLNGIQPPRHSWF